MHLTIHVNGQRVTVPKGIGIAADGSCFYWVHTHTSDGILHIEAHKSNTTRRSMSASTIWHDSFAKLGFPAALGQQIGWKIYVNGKPLRDPVSSPLATPVPLASHDVVTLEYGSHNPPPDRFYAFPPPNLTR